MTIVRRAQRHLGWSEERMAAELCVTTAALCKWAAGGVKRVQTGTEKRVLSLHRRVQKARAK